MIVLQLALVPMVLIAYADAKSHVFVSSNCQNSAQNCNNGVCTKAASSDCGGGAGGKSAKSSGQAAAAGGAGDANSAAGVIKCDDNGLFSSNSVCGPGVCCSNIPIGISGSILVLTVVVVVLTVLVMRSPTAPTPPPARTENEKLCEAPRTDGAPYPPVQPQHPVPGPSTSTETPVYHPSLQAVGALVVIPAL